MTFVCTPYLMKFVITFSLMFVKPWSVHSTATLSNLDQLLHFLRKQNQKIISKSAARIGLLG